MTIVRSPKQPIEISGVEASCAKCGHRIAVEVPLKHVATGAPQGKPPKTLAVRLVPLRGFGDPSLCLNCRLEALPDRGADVVDQYASIQNAAAAAGIPSGATILLISFDADDSAPKRWHGWTAHMLAIRVSGLPTRLKDAQSLNSLRFRRNDGGEAVEIIVYETVVGRGDLLPTALVFHSPPGTWPALLEIRGWAEVDRPSWLQELMQGVELYHVLTDGRGRPRGGPYETPAEFAEELHSAITQLRSAGIKPTQEQVVEQHLGVTVTTLRSWIRQYLRCEWGDALAWSEAEWHRAMRR